MHKSHCLLGLQTLKSNMVKLKTSSTCYLFTYILSAGGKFCQKHFWVNISRVRPPLTPGYEPGKMSQYQYVQKKCARFDINIFCWFPISLCQVTVPRDLVALMSAVRSGEEPCTDNSKKTYCFEQTVPIPSYLIAIVVGALESR